jgi:AbiV family abortive infection protein
MERAKKAFLANAADLVGEAELLLSKRRYPRAYALAHLACEELSKLPMIQRAAMQYLARGKFDWLKLHRRLTSHPEKIQAMFIHEYLLDLDIAGDADVRRLETKLASIPEQNRLKNASLYCSFVNNRCVSPRKAISAALAKAMVSLSKDRLAWFQRVERRIAGQIARMPPEAARGLFELAYGLAEGSKSQPPNNALQLTRSARSEVGSRRPRS